MSGGAARRRASAVGFGRGVRVGVAVGLAWALGPGAPACAWAQEAATQVTVLRPNGADVALAEIATRAWAELNAGGVPARLLDCPAAPAPCPTEAPAGGRNAISLRTFRRADETITEAALTPAGRDHPTVRRSLTVDDQAEADPKVMAIRAVELVNAMLLQVDAASAEGAAAMRGGVDPEDPGQHWKPEKTVVEHPAIWTIGAGGTFLKGPGGLNAAAGFAIRASRWGEGDVPFGISALVTEAPSLARTSTVDGSLILNQQLADLQLMWRVSRRHRFRSQVGVGGGAYHVDANWTGVPVPALGGRAVGMQDRWALLLSGGVGAELDLGLKMSVFGEARAELAAPYPQVYGASGRALRTADPSLLLALGLQRLF